MPVDLAEDTLDLSIELLEAGAPTPQSYPFPSLTRMGRKEQRTFRTIVLENSILRATIAPELGGRILRLEHKGAGADAWPFAGSFDLKDHGLRGVSLPTGFQVRTHFEDRLNAMGYVPCQPDFTGEEEEPAGLWWGEICGNGLSLQVRYSLPADEPYLEVEVRVLNRTLRPIPYNGGFAVDGPMIEAETGWLTQHGLFVQSDSLTYAEDGGTYRFDRGRWLAPRQLDSWTTRLYPFAGIRSLRNANSCLGVGWDAQSLYVVSAIPSPNGKVVVRTTGGAQLEVPIELSPLAPTALALDSLPDPIAELVILDHRKTELIRADSLASDRVTQAQRSEDDAPPPAIDRNDLAAETFNVGQRHLAHMLLGYAHLGQKEYALAAQAFEQSLLFNAEDHLAWWMKALAERLAGSDEQERPELLNAHFLAPLEPALRAESYLSSPSHAKEKSAVLSPLEDTPEVFIEVASLLIEADLLEEAAKWIDEALRHVDLPMLRYLLAYAFLRGSRMDVQAAEQVQLAVRPDPSPPYPYREVELAALRSLAERFPADGSIRRLLATFPA